MPVFIAELKKLLIIAKSDPKSIVGGIIAPSLLLIIFVLLFGGLSSIAIVIVNKDNGDYGQLLKQEILNTISPLGNKAYFSLLKKNEEEAISDFQKAKLAGIIIIPEDFSQAIVAKSKPGISFYLNNYHSDFAKNMRLYLQEGIYQFYNKHTGVDIKIKLNSKYKQVAWVEIIASGTLLLAFIIGGLFNYFYLFYKEDQYKTQIIYKTAANNILSTFFARIVIAMFSSVLAGLLNALLIYLLLGFNSFIFLPSLSLTIALTVVIYISIAAIASIYIKSYYAAIVGGMAGTIVLWFYSGGINAVVPASKILFIIYRIVPNSYALDIMRAGFFGQMHLTYRYDLLILTAIAAVSFTIAAYSYKKSLWG